MTIESLRQNMDRIKEIIRELYVFQNQINTIRALEANKNVVINTREKKLLDNAVYSLSAQLNILNNSTPELLDGIAFFKRLSGAEEKPEIKQGVKKNLVQIKYKPTVERAKIAVTISEKERKTFLENLSQSNLSINQLKKRFAVEKPTRGFGKPNAYAKISNRFFRNFSNKLLIKGYLNPLNNDLRKMNSPFVVGTYTSMILFTMMLSLFASFFLFILLIFYNLSLSFPFLSPVEGSTILRIFKIFWILLVIPLGTGLIMYFYPKSEGKNIGAKINQELPFVSIHMSAIVTSGVEPISIFKIITRSEEYKFTRVEFRKLLNLINFQGNDLVTALKKIARSSPSSKLRELLDGLATTITSGGDIHDYLDKHSEGLLFDYRLEREKYTKTSETFMDIYISIVIAAPMILLMLFVIMGSTGMYFMGLTTNIMSVLIILAIIVLNIGFLIFLRMKQPVF
tara:strand:- start:80 stop:1444 length:1365 start_codon:yes stop_codon:yes gene_type:complete